MDIVVRLLNALWMILLPLAVGIFFYRRWGASWRVFIIGAGTFIGSQVFHIPFNQFALLPLAGKLRLTGADQGPALLLYGTILGLSAGVFEEGARYLVYRFWLRDVRHWRGALMFGAGHGGAEAIIFGGLVLYTLLQAIAYRGADLEALLPASQLETARLQLEAYWGAPWYAALLGAVERSMAIIIQISLALIVYQAIVRRNLLWLLLGILWHTIVDAIAVVGLGIWGIYLTEAAIAGLALASLVIIVWLSRMEPAEQAEVLQPSSRAKAASDGPAAAEVLTGERLEDSRYHEGD